MTHPENSNQPEPTIVIVLRMDHEDNLHEGQPNRHCPDCIASDIPPMPSTVHNVHNQRRVIT